MSTNTLIKAVKARRVFDSRGSSTIEVEVITNRGFGMAIAPNGLSRGLYEAVSYPLGGVDEAVRLVKAEIAPKLMGMDAGNQMAIDSLLHEIDSTRNFQRIGGNTSIAISLATAKAAASSHGISLYQQLAEKPLYEMPHPLGNVISGGKHNASKNGPDMQEFLALPVDVDSFTKAAESNIRVHTMVRESLERVDATFTGGKGDEGAWATALNSDTALELVFNACESVTREFGVLMRAGLDVASSSFWDKKGACYVHSKEGYKRDAGDQIDYIINLIKTYKLAYVEDPVHEDDYEGFSEITKKAKSCIICGDDLFTTNTERLKVGVKLMAGNAIIIKPNQIGTLTDAYEAVKLAKSVDYIPIAAHRSGETCDSYLAHIAISFQCPIVKLGIVGGERLSKINELIRIEEALGEKSRMANIMI